MALTDWILAVVAILALVASAVALLLSRRAVRTAERSEAAAWRAADFAAVVQRAQLALHQDHANRWKLTRHGAATNDLVNVGHTTAYDVRVEVPAGMNILRLPTERAQVPSGDTITLGVARSKMTSGGGMIRVLWRDLPSGPEREWSHPAV